ncbi:peptide-methionine (S)-S-oxide reductase [Flavobacterium plurextorum]|uniref:peptide-methionine (S)-S-oxide reductase n=1 Tax=Flavobacterium TaxID=237 RepID=UPI00214D4692|nr:MULTISPECIES: peptide-methionine (S)-S-oxide reductase [Flavobacterium]UUW08708.1 peptide-methionine (S)-S-oxide reductase [Flavobacterium plurextorum]
MEISWGPERFLRLIEAAADKEPGNTDRDVKHVNRKKAINNKKDNVETLKVKFDTGKIGFGLLLDLFLRTLNPQMKFGRTPIYSSMAIQGFFI